MKYIISFFYIFISFGVFAQNPSYYVLGESELKNDEIYSVLQTDDERLYVTTNQGLYQYRHGRMIDFDLLSNQKGASLFNLISNNKNEVFCFNLSGQIFKVEGSKLILYAEIPKKYLGHQLWMSFDKKDNLIFASKGIIKLKEQKIEEILYKKNNSISTFNKLPDGRIAILTYQDSHILVWNGNSITYNEDKELTKTGSEHSNGIVLANGKLFNLLKTTKINEKSDRRFFKQFKSEEVWLRNMRGIGIEILNISNSIVNVKDYFFTDVFISDVFQAKDGTLFFGTYGLGLFVVPNLEAKAIVTHDFANSQESIVADDNGNVFTSGSFSSIIHYKKKLSIIRASEHLLSPKLFLLKDNPLPIFNKYPQLFLNNQLVSGHVKNIQQIDSTLLFATSLGISKYGKDFVLNNGFWDMQPNKSYSHKNISYFNSIKERCRDILYRKSDTILFIATNTALFKLNSLGNKEELTFQGNSVSVNKLLYVDNELWCATQKNGVLTYKDDSLKQKFRIPDELGHSFVSKVILDENLVYISHKKGFQIYNLLTGSWNTIGTAEGIKNGTVKDFSVTNEKIWFIANNQVISLPIKKTKNRQVKFDIQIDSIKVSDNKINTQKTNVFPYDKNKFTFHINFKGILAEAEAEMKYQLIGLDEKPKTIHPYENLIEYKSLPPNEYSFEISSTYRGDNSPKVTYDFIIKLPYWKTWWFYTAIILILTSITLTFVYYRVEKIRKENTQNTREIELKKNLIESELKVLRSQINPHFIFNSLNSIQDLVLQGDTDASYDYIEMFSALVRNALNYSNQNFISLNREVDFLKTYLELEKLRFGDEFNYNINFHNLSEELQLPSLVLQPFVENAIVHGLFQKKGEKILNIDFKLDNNLLICNIADNGIGRDAAKKIKKRQSRSYKSYALNALDKRLNILREKYAGDIGYSIFDITDNVTGTRVEIKLPYVESKFYFDSQT